MNEPAVQNFADRERPTDFPDGSAGTSWHGDNLAFVLNGAVGKVLVAGEKLRQWAAQFRECRFEPLLPLSGTGTYGLIMWSVGHRESILRSLQRLRQLSDDDGAVVVFAENPRSAANIRKMLRGKLSPLAATAPSVRAYRKVFEQAGFSVERTFIPFPDPLKAEELWSVENDEIELSPDCHFLLRGARILGCYSAMASGYVFVLRATGRRPSGEEERRQPSRDWFGDHCEIDRIDFRARGAMVLFLRRRFTTDRMIARVVEKELQGVLERNRGFLEYLHGLPALPSSLRLLLPVPVADFTRGDATVSVETRRPGIPAWKLRGAALRKRAHDQSLDFILGLRAATKRSCVMHHKELADLFEEDVARIDAAEYLDLNVRRELQEIIRKICDGLAGRSIVLTASHGDFGFGNILADGRTGELHGVIDWETGRKNDLELVDLVNFYVQLERIGGNSLSMAFLKTLSANEELQRLLSGSSSASRYIYATTYIRYVSRSIRYPVVGRRDEPEFAKTCSLVKRYLNYD